jgi:hypothetical protein
MEDPLTFQGYITSPIADKYYKDNYTYSMFIQRSRYRICNEVRYLDHKFCDSTKCSRCLFATTSKHKDKIFRRWLKEQKKIVEAQFSVVTEVLNETKTSEQKVS